MLNKIKVLLKKKRALLAVIIVLVLFLVLALIYATQRNNNQKAISTEPQISRDEFFKQESTKSVEDKRAYVSHLLSFNKDEEPNKIVEAENTLIELVNETKSSVDAFAILRFCEQYKKENMKDCFSKVSGSFDDIEKQDFFTVYPLARIYDFYAGDKKLASNFYEIALEKYPTSLSSEDMVMSKDEIEQKIKDLKS